MRASECWASEGGRDTDGVVQALWKLLADSAIVLFVALVCIDSFASRHTGKPCIVSASMCQGQDKSAAAAPAAAAPAAAAETNSGAKKHGLARTATGGTTIQGTGASSADEFERNRIRYLVSLNCRRNVSWFVYRVLLIQIVGIVWVPPAPGYEQQPSYSVSLSVWVCVKGLLVCSVLWDAVMLCSDADHTKAPETALVDYVELEPCDSTDARGHW